MNCNANLWSEDLVHMGTSDLVFFKKNQKTYFWVLENFDICLHVANYYPQKHGKKSCLDNCNFGLHKNEKHLDLSMFSIYKFYQILLFCVAYNTNNFVIKLCTLVGYIIDYVRIF
jgi:hypothetical protein